MISQTASGIHGHAAHTFSRLGRTVTNEHWTALLFKQSP
jgi:hypothetical protein